MSTGTTPVSQEQSHGRIWDNTSSCQVRLESNDLEQSSSDRVISPHTAPTTQGYINSIYCQGPLRVGDQRAVRSTSDEDSFEEKLLHS